MSELDFDNICEEDEDGCLYEAKGLDLNALGDIQGIPLLWLDIESREEKPWRKPGADISEYFNYSFNEDTWKAYCGKQRRVRGSWENISSASSRMKIRFWTLRRRSSFSLLLLLLRRMSFETCEHGFLDRND
ncbi:unnamed protein product [Lota lota]